VNLCKQFKWFEPFKTQAAKAWSDGKLEQWVD
jgi:hypothetical protein